MAIIWKFPVPIQDVVDLQMPVGAQILDCQLQNADVCLWALVEDERAPTEPRRIHVVGTGQPVERVDDVVLEYIGTVQINRLVWHLFEESVL